MAGSEITEKGLDEVIRGVRLLSGSTLTNSLGRAAMGIGEQLRGIVAVYPAQRPPAHPNHWYERGFGTRWRRKDGTVGGRKTSEFLGRSWAVERKGAMGAVVGTNVSYAHWVQSEESQTSVHRETGWTTDETAVQEMEESGVAYKIVVDAVEFAIDEAGLE